MGTFVVINIEFMEASPIDYSEVIEAMREFADEMGYPGSVKVTAYELDKLVKLSGGALKISVCRSSGQLAGFAVYYRTYISFLPHPSFYIEDIFVRRDFRARGVARRFFQYIAKTALDDGAIRLKWSVQAGNSASSGLSVSIGGQPDKDWIIYRLDDLQQLALGN
jgi:GNAT superfamily N-acetyltransferase